MHLSVEVLLFWCKPKIVTPYRTLSPHATVKNALVHGSLPEWGVEIAYWATDAAGGEPVQPAEQVLGDM